jgi:elongation factor Ts
LVKELREKTGAPMMECKKALTQAEGDLARAEEVLRVRLGNKASKVSLRVAAEGVIGCFVSVDAKQGALIEVNCETDFVAKSEDFIDFANQLAQQIAIHHPADVAALSQLPLGAETVETARIALIGKVGENIALRRFGRIQTQNALASYVHGGKLGALVDYTGAKEVGKDVALHIVANKPYALDSEGVSPEAIATERSIAMQKAAELGKPPEIVAKMVEGSVQKFLREVTLLSQPFIKDDTLTVAQMLKAKHSAVSDFVLFQVGEGIEKKTSDFAAEVAAAAGLA